MRRLARSVPGLWPEPGIACRMEYREHDDAVRVNAIEDSVWKSRHVGTPYFAVHAAEHFGDTFDRIERGVNRCKELLPQTSALILIPPKSPSQVPPHLAAVDDRHGHQRRRASAKRSPRDTTSSGLRSVSATRSSITARWASPRGTPAGSVARLSQISSTRRNRSSTGSFRISATSVSLMVYSLPPHLLERANVEAHGRTTWSAKLGALLSPLKREGDGFGRATVSREVMERGFDQVRHNQIELAARQGATGW